MLTEAFSNYLQAGATVAAATPLADALEARLSMEAGLLRNYVRSTTRCTLAQGVFHIGPRPPVAAKYGEYWFDTCELSTMILLPFFVDPADRPQLSDEARVRIEESRAWFAIHPIRAFQYRAFLRVAPLADGFAADRTSSELAPVTGINCAQAGAFLHWFGKHFPNETHWLAAREFLTLSPWGEPAKEWVGESSFDETRCVANSPDTLELDPEEHDQMLYRASAVPDDVTFRSALLMIYGLQTEDVASQDALIFGRLQRPTDA